MNRCPTTVTWYDLDTTPRCVRPEGHEGWHRDGTRWFDAYGMQVPRDPELRGAKRTATAGAA